MVRTKCFGEGVPLYLGDWDKKRLPSPPWETRVSLLDPSSFPVDELELDPKVVSWVKRKTRGWGREELFAEMSKFPSFKGSEVWENDANNGVPEEKELPSPISSPISPE